MDKTHAFRPGEFAMIDRIFAPLATSPGALGLTDDAALVALKPGQEMVVTADTLVEGVHFFRDDPPELIAQKALRVNLSDLAAKGAEPLGYLLTLSLAPWIDEDWLKSFANGLGADQMEFGIALLGGDTTATPGPLTLSITAMGSVGLGMMIRRGGARPGDLVFVSGTIGDAGGGLAVLKGEAADASPSAREVLIGRYRRPTPRLGLGRLLPPLASASLDVSDGLLADLAHIAEVSAVGIVIEVGSIPLTPSLRELWGNSDEAVIRAATAGDDYELAFTAPAILRERVVAAAEAAGVSITEIGRVQAGSGVLLLDRAGNRLPVEKSGFTHF